MPTLTPTEQMYLETLEKYPDGLSLEKLVEIKRPEPKLRDTSIVLTHIKNIRRKLPRNMEIETIRGFGYRLVKK